MSDSQGRTECAWGRMHLFASFIAASRGRAPSSITYPSSAFRLKGYYLMVLLKHPRKFLDNALTPSQILLNITTEKFRPSSSRTVFTFSDLVWRTIRRAKAIYRSSWCRYVPDWNGLRTHIFCQNSSRHNLFHQPSYETNDFLVP